MKPSTLHKHIRDSLHGIVSNRYKSGLRRLLESGSAEGFLRDLLVIEVAAHGHKIRREFRKGHSIVDLVLHQRNPLYIEAKQLHLKDRARYAKNLVKDLERHPKGHCLGIVYVLDEGKSTLKMKVQLARGANRKARCELPDFISELHESFKVVYPIGEQKARIHRFDGAGRLDLYAFVVRS